MADLNAWSHVVRKANSNAKKRQSLLYSCIYVTVSLFHLCEVSSQLVFLSRAAE